MKKSLLLIGLGFINLLHASLHIVQVIQSLLLLNTTFNHDEHNWINEITHNPIFAIVWSLIAIITLWMGIKDFIHHKKHCKS